MKLLRKILDRIPHGVGPSSNLLDLLIIVTGIAAFMTTILSILAVPLALESSFLFGMLGTALVSYTLLPFFTFVADRLYASVGPVLHDQLFLARQSLKLAKKQLEESGLHENSEPALLLKEAQELYSQIIVSAKSLHRKFNSWDPYYTMESLEFAVATQKLPEELLEQLKALVEVTLPLEVFFDVFNASLARSIPSSFKVSEQATLSYAATNLQASLDAASERTLFDAGARVEIEKMFDDEVTLKTSRAKPASANLT